MSKSDYSNLSSSTSVWVQRNARAIRNLPEPGSEWMAEVLPGNMNRQIAKLHSEGIIRPVGKIGKGGDYRLIWETNPDTWPTIQSLISEPEGLLPCCTESWIKNERGVDGITCGECGEIHDRSEVA